MVVDEAHHIDALGELESIINRFASKNSSAWLLLLSDVSQSSSIEMSNKFDAQEIRLKEVSQKPDVI